MLWGGKGEYHQTFAQKLHKTSFINYAFGTVVNWKKHCIEINFVTFSKFTMFFRLFILQKLEAMQWNGYDLWQFSNASLAACNWCAQKGFNNKTFILRAVMWSFHIHLNFLLILFCAFWWIIQNQYGRVCNFYWVSECKSKKILPELCGWWIKRWFSFYEKRK